MATPPPPATASGSPVFLDAAALHSLLPASALVPHFLSSIPVLSPSIVSPSRLSFPLDPSASSKLLLMPSWSAHPALPFVGLKALTSFPRLSPSIHAQFLLFSSSSGAPLATLDGTLLTLLRTSAVSAAAAQLLARPDSETLVIAGAGALAPHLVSAHRLALPNLKKILIWNRTTQKAVALVEKLKEQPGNVEFEHAECLDEAVAVADVISCATSSESPIVRGELLKPGAHLGLVGSFTPAMRECDDEALRRGRVFVDFDIALEEAGELVGAFERGVMAPGDVVGTLAELAGGVKVGRRSPDEVTVFKSVGTAVVDLLAAQLAYENYLRGRFAKGKWASDPENYRAKSASQPLAFSHYSSAGETSPLPTMSAPGKTSHPLIRNKNWKSSVI